MVLKQAREQALKTLSLLSILLATVYLVDVKSSTLSQQTVLNKIALTLSPNSTTDERIKEWFATCNYIYLDVGSNVGIQIRKLFEPELYADAPILPIFDDYFGPNRHNRTDVCAIGFEPNIHHTERLKALESSYNSKGWRVMIFTETAASTQDGTAEFFFDTMAAPEHHEWGASIIPWQADMVNPTTKSTVRTVDLAKFVLDFIGETTLPGSTRKVLMKMDIEGAEHRVLPHMIISGAMCKIDLVFTEFHDWGEILSSTLMSDRDFAKFFEEYVENYDSTSCKARIGFFDDETYGSSEFPLPELLRRLV